VPTVVRFAGESVVGEQGRWSRAAAEEWAEKTGNKVEYISRPNDPSAALQQFRQYWAAKSPDIDVYIVDVIWQGILAPHAVDLKKYFNKDETNKFFPRIIENNTVDGRLVSIPWFADAGLPLQPLFHGVKSVFRVKIMETFLLPIAQVT
jgi:trehalose/maltose transport system substrate-binding protein